MRTLGLIDADSMIYIVAYQFRNKKTTNAVRLSLNSFLSEVLKVTKCNDYIGFYGSKEPDSLPNFRESIFTNYKANRPPAPDFIIKWRPLIHSVMKEKWKFIPVEGMEADDAVSIAANQFKGVYDRIVVITGDKDLKQIPNIEHFNFDKFKTTITDEFSGAKFLATQMLMGDRGDNIPGLPGIGPAKAEKILCDASTIQELSNRVIKAYIKHFEMVHQAYITEQLAKVDTSHIKPESYPSEAQYNRAVAIAKRKELLAITSSINKREYKEYMKTQYSLLKLLDESPIYPKFTPILFTDELYDSMESDDFLKQGI